MFFLFLTVAVPQIQSAGQSRCMFLEHLPKVLSAPFCPSTRQVGASLSLGGTLKQVCTPNKLSQVVVMSQKLTSGEKTRIFPEVTFTIKTLCQHVVRSQHNTFPIGAAVKFVTVFFENLSSCFKW